MKKVLGLTLAITVLTIGSMTVYGATESRETVHTATCVDRANCQGDGTCVNGQECTDPDCPNEGIHTYDASSCHSGQNGCSISNNHHQRNHGHGRGHH